MCASVAGGWLRRQAVGVQIVVDGEPADLELIGDVLDGLAQGEGTELVEPADRPLLSRSIEVAQCTSHLLFDSLDDAFEGSLEPGGAEPTDEFTIPVQGDVPITEFVGLDHGAA